MRLFCARQLNPLAPELNQVSDASIDMSLCRRGALSVHVYGEDLAITGFNDVDTLDFSDSTVIGNFVEALQKVSRPSKFKPGKKH